MSNIACILVTRDRPTLVSDRVREMRDQWESMDIYVVEMGTQHDLVSEHEDFTTIHYSDEDFRGKAFAHNVGIDFAMRVKKYDYFFITMNDAKYDPTVGFIQRLEMEMATNPEYGIISPTCLNEHHYPGAKALTFSSTPRPVTTVDYLSFMMRGEMIYRDKRLFLNPKFKYCWGAIHELSFKMYQEGLKLGYTDSVSYDHLGGSTYGAIDSVISRDDYIRRAKEFARKYMVNTYGDRWDSLMYEQAISVAPEIKQDSYSWSRGNWE